MSNNKHEAAYHPPTTPISVQDHPITKDEKHARNRARNKKFLGYASVAAGGLILGSIFGAAGGSNKTEATPVPQETVTVTETVTVQDETCRLVATELWSVIGSMNSEVLAPLSQAASDGVVAAGMQDIAAMDAVTERVLAINDVQIIIADRVSAVGPDFQECTQ